jgi:phosphoribosyl-AMP cyclohydrolase
MSIWLKLEQAQMGDCESLQEVIAAIPWNQDGLIAAIAQQHDSGEVLMLAWMNQQSLLETLSSGQVCYWSRSRQQLWRKGESSGHTQRLINARFDCDGDAILLLVDQQGPACHTNRPNCFHNEINMNRVTVISTPQKQPEV